MTVEEILEHLYQNQQSDVYLDYGVEGQVNLKRHYFISHLELLAPEIVPENIYLDEEGDFIVRLIIIGEVGDSIW